MFDRINLEEHVFSTTQQIEPEDNSPLKSNSSHTSIPWIVCRKTCIIVFTVLTLSVIISTLVRSALFVSVCTTSSTNLHNRMLESIIRATMYFFNKNSSGYIIIKIYDYIIHT